MSYKENLKLLRHYDPKLFLRVRRCQIGKDLVPFDAGGYTSCLIETEGGVRVYLHSKRDPVEEARRYLHGIDLGGQRIIVVLGLGLGYILLELIRRLKGKQEWGCDVVVIEKRLDLLKESLKAVDWSDIFKFPNIHLIVGRSLSETMNGLEALVSGHRNVLIIPHKPALSIYPIFYSSMSRVIHKRSLKKERHRLKMIIFKRSDIMIIPDVEHGFREIGADVEVLDLRMYTKEDGGFIDREHMREIIKKILSFQPNFVFTINHIGFLPDIFTEMKLPHASWFVDNPFLWITKRHLSPYCCIFVWEKTFLPRLFEYGFEHAFHLPLCTNHNIFRPLRLTESEKRRYGCEVSFVGSSGYDFYKRCYIEAMKISKDPNYKEFCRRVIERQAQDPLRDVLDIIKEVGREMSYTPKFGSEILDRDFGIWLEFSAMSIYRRETLKALKDFDLRLYGDEGWREVGGGDLRYCGRIHYYNEVPRLYNATKINLNLTRSQMKTAINQRVYDVSACGSFVLNDYREDLKELFDIEREIVWFKDRKDLIEKIRYFLKHETERVEIAERAKRRVLSEHTYVVRMRYLVDRMREVFGF